MPKNPSAVDIPVSLPYNRNMENGILKELSALSDEERAILKGQSKIVKGDYSSSDSFIVNSKKLLGGDRQIDLRLHTRFIDFPEHGHDYMEFM